MRAQFALFGCAALNECSGNIFASQILRTSLFIFLNIWRRQLIPKIQTLPVLHFPREPGRLVPDGNLSPGKDEWTFK